MIRAVAVIPAALALAACATRPLAVPPPVPVIQTVATPLVTPASCVPADYPQPPTYPDSRASLSAATPDGRYAQMAAGWGPRDARLSADEAVIAACR